MPQLMKDGPRSDGDILLLKLLLPPLCMYNFLRMFLHEITSRNQIALIYCYKKNHKVSFKADFFKCCNYHFAEWMSPTSDCTACPRQFSDFMLVKPGLLTQILCAFLSMWQTLDQSDVQCSLIQCFYWREPFPNWAYRNTTEDGHVTKLIWISVQILIRLVSMCVFFTVKSFRTTVWEWWLGTQRFCQMFMHFSYSKPSPWDHSETPPGGELTLS